MIMLLHYGNQISDRHNILDIHDLSKLSWMRLTELIGNCFFGDRACVAVTHPLPANFRSKIDLFTVVRGSGPLLSIKNCCQKFRDLWK